MGASGQKGIASLMSNLIRMSTNPIEQLGEEEKSDESKGKHEAKREGEELTKELENLEINNVESDAINSETILNKIG